MPQDLVEGLYVTGVGMGVVLFALTGFLLIMLALQRLFPGQETPAAGQGEGAPRQELQTREKHAPADLPEPLQATRRKSYSGVTGAQIAAIAAAAYLSMEQEVQLQPAPRVIPAPALPQGDSDWSTQARTLLTESQSRRPPPYGEKPHSAYSPRAGLS